MTKVFGHYMSSDVLMLWLIEAVLSFTLIAALLAFGTAKTVMGEAAFAGTSLQIIDMAALVAVLFGIVGPALGLYRRDTLLYTRRLVINIGVVAIVVVPVPLVLARLLHADFLRLITTREALWLPHVLLAWLFCLMVTRTAFRLALRHGVFTRRILFVGDDQRVLFPSDGGAHQTAFFDVAGTLAGDEAEALDPAALRARGIWGIVVGTSADAKLPTTSLLHCKSAGIRVFDAVEFRERQFRRLAFERLPADWLIFAETVFTSRLNQALKRGFDVALSLALLVLVLPLMLLTALAIRLDSKGSVFYSQERVGLGGKPFTLLKFRSMRADAEATGPAWAAAADPRVTRIGGFLRRTRIDELPQLLNVLRGEMSLIGPRPERPHFVAKLAATIPHYNDRSFVKPGITGWAQVNLPYGASIEDARMKLAYDLYYIAHRTLFLDLLILVSTVRVILFREGAR